jgi:hypothetical protein
MRWIKIAVLMTITFLIIALLPGCKSASSSHMSASIHLDQEALPIMGWKQDGSQTRTVQGTVLLNGSPVSDVELQIGDNRIAKTDDHGAFSLLIDQSNLSRTAIKIKSAGAAKVKGRVISTSEKNALLNQQTYINAAFPIKLTSPPKASPDGKSVELQAKLITDIHPFPTIRLDQYRITGIVLNAAGSPVQGAVVSIARDGGEGFAQSPPSDAKGYYAMPYLSDEDEDTDLRVSVGDKQYNLPPGRTYHFPGNTSVEVDITLPVQGTYLIDKEPYLDSKTTQGAQYQGIYAGLQVPDGTPYKLTVPLEDGSFTATLPKDVWDKHPAFYESKITAVSQDRINPGDPIPAGLIKPPKATEPQNIQTVK